MKTIGNIIWFLFGGILMALEYFIFGLFWCFTIVGIPLGLQLFKIAGLSLWPFGRVVRHKQQTVGCLSTGLNVLWFILGGILIALEHAILGLFFFVTIIGIPFGKQHFKLAAIAFAPFGNEIMSAKKSRRLDEQNNAVESYRVASVEKSIIDETSASEIKMESELSEEEANASALPTFNTAEILSDIPSDKLKVYSIGGGIIAILAIIIGIFTYTGLRNSGGNDLLPVEKPTWEKFVVITQDTPLFKETDMGSSKLAVTMEDLESDAIVRNFKWNDVPDRRGWTSYDVMVSKDAVLPVVSENGDWYRVVYEDSEMGPAEGYVQKTNCREVKPEPITAELLAHMTDYNGHKANFGLQNEGKYKNICFISIMADMDGNCVDVAVLTDGKLINPLTRRIFTAWQRCADAAFEDVEGQLAYREDMEQDGMFDARNIKTEADAELLFNAMPMNQSDYQKVAYFFPEISKTKLFVFTQNFEEASSSVISEAQDDPEDPEITQALNDFQDLIERVHGMVEECEKTGEMTGNTICQEVEEARDELNEKVNRMSEEQILQFEALCQKAKDLIQYADSVNNIATVAVAVDSAIVEM